ncbi:DegT/DnrJ/EryC1/StrS family aminotransferase [Candidatus Gottesmanbacteria bacterium]|nr:DegT/DnrJ/EryC1/StrS family aminotransferase [Candidatus Gottesmanbacteria bacterium]
MKINFVDIYKQHQALKTQIDGAIFRVIKNSTFIGGEEVEMFEREFANYCGVKNCVVVNSGTDALRIICYVLGIGPGDEVIIPVNTFIATALAVSSVGARPVFVDCRESDYTIDPTEIEKKITLRTKAIIPIHLFGQPANMFSVCDIARKKGLLIIEDACQAHGAKFKGTRVGGFGHAAAFSFYPSKNLGAYGDGGAIVTNDTHLANKLRLYREYGQGKKNIFTTQGVNSRLDGIQAAILRVKLPHLDEWNRQRLEIARWYRQLLMDFDIILPTIPEDRDHVFHLFVIRTNHRDRLKLFLEKRGVSCGIHYPIPIHQQPVYQHFGHTIGDFKVAEKVAEQMLSLPMFPELTREAVDYIAIQIKDFFSKL